MIYALDFTEEAKSSLAKYKKSSPQLFKKITKLLLELSEHPKTGTGHPEPLIGGNGITYSRRISGQHRIIYDILEDVIKVYVISVEGHYNDK